MSIIEITRRGRCEDCVHCKEYHVTKKNGEPYKTAFHFCEIRPSYKNVVYLKDLSCEDFKLK